MVQVIKANGEKEEFSEEKVKRSIIRARIPKDIQQNVVDHVKSKLYDSIPTSEIYNHITEFLEKSPYPYTKAKYSLKQAIMDLGPTGYPFEDFISEVLKTKGYLTQVRTIVQGVCISHEIDVIAHKEVPRAEETTIIEAKFHNASGIKTDIHVALYTKARFDDIKTRHGFGKVWLITNTKVTGDVITYGQCVDMKITSWSYPEGQSLRDLVEASGLAPLTTLTTLSKSQKMQLLQNHIVLCKTICKDSSCLRELGLSQEQTKNVIAEAEEVCKVLQKEPKKPFFQNFIPV